MISNFKLERRLPSVQISNSQQGFTMIELIIGLAILSFGIIAVYSVFFPAITQTYNVSSRLTAVYLAQEGLEIVRNIRDNNFIAGNNWAQGLLSCNLGCQASYKAGTAQQQQADQLAAFNPSQYLTLDADGFYSYSETGISTKFQRNITITQELGTDILRVVSNVSWNFNGQPYNYQTDEYIYNWY